MWKQLEFLLGIEYRRAAAVSLEMLNQGSLLQ